MPFEKRIVDGDFVDSLVRKRILKFINVYNSMKPPAAEPFLPSYGGNSLDANSLFFEGDKVSFVGGPSHELGIQNRQFVLTWGHRT